MANWFNTLNEALESESLLHTWDTAFPPVKYDSTAHYTYTENDDSRYGTYVSVYRDERGMYERPIHYERKLK